MIGNWLFCFLGIHLVYGCSTWKLYKLANRKKWEAFVPIYNWVVLLKIVNRPIRWIFLLFIPVINLLLIPVLWVQTARAFNKTSSIDTLVTLSTFGFYIPYLNYNSKELVYQKDRDHQPKNQLQEWVNSILFAIIAATLVHTYIMQPFVIPSSSLEKTLWVGDYLFVSKFHYGARVPMTTISLPMVHDTIPLTQKKSYVFDDRYEKRNSSWYNKFQLPYLRIPGFQKIKRNDIVVFNQPADTLLDMNDFTPNRNYYKPIDKKTNLVKRCVGIPGDTLKIEAGYVYINGKQLNLPSKARTQYNFFLDTHHKKIPQSFLKNTLNAREGVQYANGDFALLKQGGYYVTLTDKEALIAEKSPYTKKVTKQLQPKEQSQNLFPHSPDYSWNTDNFGTIYIPKKGATINLNLKNLPLYKRVIQEYEQNELKTVKGKISINGKLATQYTFKQDYYWMIGDNRQNSIDSRFWGFVPFDHVVGKPVFIWMSIDNNKSGLKKIRWNRMFTLVDGNSNTTSYFVHFIVVILIYQITMFLLRRKKKHEIRNK